MPTTPPRPSRCSTSRQLSLPWQLPAAATSRAKKSGRASLQAHL